MKILKAPDWAENLTKILNKSICNRTGEDEVFNELEIYYLIKDLLPENNRGLITEIDTPDLPIEYW